MSPPPPHSSNKRKKVGDDDARSSALNAISETLKNRRQTDIYDDFGRFAAGQLRQMSARTASEVMLKMQHLLHSTLYPSTETSESPGASEHSNLTQLGTFNYSDYLDNY